MNWFSRRSLPPAVQAYVDATAKGPARKRPIDEIPFVVLDAETTGFNVQQDKLLSLATVRIQAGQLSLPTARSWLIFQEAVRVNEAVTVHGILPCDTQSGVPQDRVVEELLPELSGAVIVGHHIGFDAALLNAAFQRRYGIGLQNRLLDTAGLSMIAIDAFARVGYANQRPPTLDEVCAHCGIEMMDRHTAAGDTYTTAELFLLLCAKLRQRYKRPLVAGDLPINHV